MRRLFLYLVTALAAILFSLATGELLLRAAGFSSPRFFVRDAVTGSWHNPGTQGWSHHENKTWVHINADGMRDVEHAFAKPRGTFRIAVLGDSYAEAMQVPLNATFWNVMGRELGRCGAFGRAPIEVLNFGVSGFGTGQELLALRSRVWKYSPDLVLLAFLTGNDIRNNSKALEPEKEIPFFYLNAGKLELDNTFRNSNGYRRGTSAGARIRDVSSRYSRIVQLLELTKERLRKRETAEAQAQRFPGLEASQPVEVYRPAATGDWSDAWAITEALLLSMRDEVGAAGARLVVTTLSNAIQVNPDPEARQRFMVAADVKDLFYPDERIQRFLASSDIEDVTLAPRMQAYAETRKIFLHGFPGANLGMGHWNLEGHRVAGEYLAQYLCKTGGSAALRQ